MELNFEQVNGAYVASVKVDSAYALHLERAGRCPLAVLQRHGEAGQYVPCPLPAVTGSLAPAVVDVALDHGVYPVEVKIVSGLEPHVSTLTPYAGGGGGGGIPDAPQDGVLYGRKDGTWSAVPDPSGDIAVLQGRLDTAEGDIDALQQADTAQDGRLDTAEGEIDALEARMDPIADKVEAMPAAYTLDSSLFHITDESTSEQIRDALEASGGFEAIVEALKRGDALYLHYSGEGWDGTYTESGINLVYGYVIEDDNGTTNLCLYFTRKNNIDVYDIYHDPDDDTYSARNWDYDLSVLDSDEYPLSTLGQKYQQLEASQAQQDEKITALETAQTEQGQRLTAAEGDIAALEGRMDTAEGEIDALQAADTALDGRLDALETSQGQQDGKITALEAADTALGERLTTAEGEIDALQQADTELGERLDTAEGKITTAEGEIDALQQADAGQDEKITALETADAAHDEAIGSLEQKVEGLEAGGGFPEAPQDGTLYGRKDGAWAAVPDPSGEITALEGRMDTAEGEIDALQTAGGEQDTKIEALETAQTQQAGRLDMAETDIEALEGRMDTAESEIDDLTGRVTTLEEQGGGGGLPEAPTNGKTYGRKAAAWAEVPNEIVGNESGYETLGFIRAAVRLQDSRPYWIPIAIYDISAYELNERSDGSFFLTNYYYNGLLNSEYDNFFVIMGGCTAASQHMPVLYSVSKTGSEDIKSSLTFTGVDYNNFPDVYKFTFTITHDPNESMNGGFKVTESTVQKLN